MGLFRQVYNLCCGRPDYTPLTEVSSEAALAKLTILDGGRVHVGGSDFGNVFNITREEAVGLVREHFRISERHGHPETEVSFDVTYSTQTFSGPRTQRVYIEVKRKIAQESTSTVEELSKYQGAGWGSLLERRVVLSYTLPLKQPEIVQA